MGIEETCLQSAGTDVCSFQPSSTRESRTLCLEDTEAIAIIDYEILASALSSWMVTSCNVCQCANISVSVIFGFRDH